MSEAERKMFGFEIVSEYTGRVFKRSPDDSRVNTKIRNPYIPELRRGGDMHAAPFEGSGTDEG